jgi:hypothetical protein
MARNCLIDLGYTLVLYLKQSIFSNATIVKIPIYIGTIPIQDNQTNPFATFEFLASYFSSTSYRQGYFESGSRIPIHYVKDEEMNNLFNIQTYKGNGPFYPFYNFTN